MSQATDTTTETAAENQPLNNPRKVLAAGSIGNLMEWYDFAIYGYLAPYIATNFFPTDDPLSSLLATYGAFAAGYLARPLGAMVFGHIGDRFGRKHVLTISILMMGLSSVCIGLLPTYAQIGPVAGVLLVFFRVLQGISVGGEFSGSIVFTAEHAPAKKRGLFASFANIGSTAGFLLGSALVALMAALVSDEVLSDGIWRIAFLSGAIIMVIGILMRRTLTLPEAVDSGEDSLPPVVAAVRHHWRDILRVAGLALSANVGFYIMFVFAVSYLTDEMHVSTQKAMDINTAALVVIMLFVPLGGYLSDKFGRKPVLLTANLALLLGAYPMFAMLHNPSDTLIFLGQAGFGLIVGILFGVNPATMAEISPKAVRVSVLSIGYNVALAAFGGTAPAVATYLIARTSEDMSPAYYMMVFAVLALITTLSFKEPAGRSMT